MRPTISIMLLIAAFAGGPTGCMNGPMRESAHTQIELPEGISPELVAQAKRMMTIVAREIDKPHVTGYDLPDPTPGDNTLTNEDLGSMFVDAVIHEYGHHLDAEGKPTLLRERLETLASQIMFSAPEVTTDESVGRMTPFHGMDEGAFESLMANEDTVFNHHMQVNGGSPKGVRPFSVCETTYLIKLAKGQITDQSWATSSSTWTESGGQANIWQISDYDGYARAYQAFAASCSQKDLSEWYDFRGLGALRPTWLESNISDRFLGRMQSECDDPSPEFEDDCAAWETDRLGYRDRKNTELTLREIYYDPRPEAVIPSSWGGSTTMEQFILNPSNNMALVEDRNGDGIGEMIAPGALRTGAGTVVSIGTDQSFALPADQTVTLKSATTMFRDNGDRVSLAKNTKITVRGGTQVNFGQRTPYSLDTRGPVGINAGRTVRLQGGTTGTLEDGSTVRVPSQGEVEGARGTVEVKLGTAVSLAVATDNWTPNLEFRKVSTGVLAANQFAYEFAVGIPLTTGSTLGATIAARDVGAYDGADPAWNRDYLTRADLGMQTVFADGSGCMADSPSPDSCPLLRRFYAIIDRHETFYQTYSNVRPDAANISQQPSPLVACSITLRASHHWDTAGAQAGGNAGFIYLMRIPFNEILAGDTRSIDTLGLLQDADGNGQPDNNVKAGPQVLTVQELYQHGAQLDLSKVWLDIATLSNNAFSSEHEVSKFGSVPAEQIEGILVIRRPASLSETTTQ